MKTTASLRNNSPNPNFSVELCNFVFLDIETTGFRPDRGARITEVAIINRNSVHYSYKSTPAQSDTLARKDLITIINCLSNGVVVGHNLSFDLWFIAYEAHLIGLDGPDIKLIDTLSLARRILPAADSHKLSHLLELFKIQINGEIHTAITDAEATRALFWKLLEKGNISTVGQAGLKQLNWTIS